MSEKELLDQLAGFAKAAYQYDGEIDESTSFEELGGGSMRMIALTSTIENELDAEVTIHEIMKMKTFGELVERVAEELED